MTRLASVGSDLQMELYGLHKIATEGPCREQPPMALKVYHSNFLVEKNTMILLSLFGNLELSLLPLQPFHRLVWSKSFSFSSTLDCLQLLCMSDRGHWLRCARNAWQRLGNMSPEAAMEQYIALVLERAPGWMEEKPSVVETGGISFTWSLDMLNRGKGIFWVYSPNKYRNMDRKNNLQEFHGCWHGKLHDQGHLGPPELFQGSSDFNFPCWNLEVHK
ncbi:hypothetical protein NC652_032255 [Populus alba x Populus x berolinensis]|nr:hypothetical protein NC652_032255 [Populus alba x Populus x berolinensis]